MIKDLGSKVRALSECPLCGSPKRCRLYGFESYSAFECADCQLRYIDPCLSDEGTRYFYSSESTLLELNPFHQNYYDYGDPTKPSVTVRDFEKALEILEGKRAPEGRRIFDAGCGNGLFLAVAKKRGWIVAGCDPSARNVSLAAERFGVNVCCDEFDHFRSGQEKYDAVAFWDVLEHLADPHAFVRKAAEMLRPGGMVVAGVPNDRSFLRILASILYRASLGTLSGPLKKVYLLEHVAYYSRGTLERLFKSHGLLLAASFRSSTDLKKYHLGGEKTLAATVLALGKLCGLENRLIAVFRKPA